MLKPLCGCLVGNLLVEDLGAKLIKRRIQSWVSVKLCCRAEVPFAPHRLALRTISELNDVAVVHKSMENRLC